ncbi:unnamed protein product, partial [Vitis vinifera]
MTIHPDPNTCLFLLCPLDTHLVVHSWVQLPVLQSWMRHIQRIFSLRLVCPIRNIGGVIRKGGVFINQIRRESGAIIKVDSTSAAEADDCLVTILAKERLHFPRGPQTSHCIFLYRMCMRLWDWNCPSGTFTVRLLVSFNQIGCVIGKGGQIIQSIRSESGAQIRILKDDHLPSCSLSSNELIQISKEPSIVRKILYQIASRLHDNPSRSQHLFVYVVPIGYSSSGSLMGLTSGAPIMDEASSKEFSLCLVCPIGNIGGMIGKGDVIINQIRQEFGATIKVDSTSVVEANDCLVTISAKERLHLFKVNLLEESSLDSIVERLVSIFHSTFIFFHAITNLIV